MGDCLCCAGQLKRGQKYFCSVGCRDRYRALVSLKKGTICWSCENTSDVCPYFQKEARPVEGWVADKGKHGGFVVKFCPQFRLSNRLRHTGVECDNII